ARAAWPARRCGLRKYRRRCWRATWSAPNETSPQRQQGCTLLALRASMANLAAFRKLALTMPHDHLAVLDRHRRQRATLRLQRNPHGVERAPHEHQGDT